MTNGYPRKPTKAEKTQLKRLFPKMDLNKVLVTDASNPKYNCLAWTLGYTDRWLWPVQDTLATKKQLDDYYRKYSIAPGQNGEIAAFGHTPKKMSHVAISGPGHGSRWESKLGEYPRIQHGLSELEKGYFGNVKGFYSKGRGLVLTPEEFDVKAPPPTHEEKEKKMREYLQIEEVEYLDKRTAKIPNALKVEFEKTYNAWKDTWNEPTIAISSDPWDRRLSKEYRELICLGSDILPLLMQKLLNIDEFFTLQVVEPLARDEILIEYDLEDPSILKGEQWRAIETLKRWIALEA